MYKSLSDITGIQFWTVGGCQTEWCVQASARSYRSQIWTAGFVHKSQQEIMGNQRWTVRGWLTGWCNVWPWTTHVIRLCHNEQKHTKWYLIIGWVTTQVIVLSCKHSNFLSDQLFSYPHNQSLFIYDNWIFLIFLRKKVRLIDHRNS